MPDSRLSIMLVAFGVEATMSAAQMRNPVKGATGSGNQEPTLLEKRSPLIMGFSALQPDDGDSMVMRPWERH